jgi:lactoylglutathione lyase
MKIRNAGYPIDIDPKQGLDLNWQAWTKDPNGVRIELMQIMPGSPHSNFR